MNSSIKLLSVRGIDIRVHITFPLIFIWAALQYGWLNGGGLSGAIFGVIAVTFLFVIVTLHELGHSVAAQGYGIPVKQIVLLPIGGVAQLSRIPEKPSQELVVAIAGPAVNFALAILMAILALLPGLGFVSPAEAFSDVQEITLSLIFTYIFAYNLFLGFFNLLPAFPMDGGRVLRALLATRTDYMKATAVAVTVGRGLAWLLGLFGFVSGNFFLILVAIFIYVGAGQEGQLVQVRSLLRGVTVQQAYSREVHALRPQANLRDAIDLTLRTLQASFPVMEDGRLVGILPYRRLVEALNEHGPEMLVSHVMLRDVSPVAADDELFEVQQRLTEKKIDALPVMEGDQFLGLITSQDIGEVYRLMSINPDLLTDQSTQQKPEAPHAPLVSAGS